MSFVRCGALVLGAAVLGWTVLSCHSGLGSPDGVYSVRGQVVEREGSGADTRVSFAHEAIPGFKDRDGKVSGMPAMTMIFALAPKVDAAVLEAGTRWKVTFEVRWTREPVLRVTRIARLPPDTKLKLAPKR